MQSVWSSTAFPVNLLANVNGNGPPSPWHCNRKRTNWYLDSDDYQSTNYVNLCLLNTFGVRPHLSPSLCCSLLAGHWVIILAESFPHYFSSLLFTDLHFKEKLTSFMAGTLLCAICTNIATLLYRRSHTTMFVDSDDCPREIRMLGYDPLHGGLCRNFGRQTVTHELDGQKRRQKPHHDVTVTGGGSTADVGIGIGSGTGNRGVTHPPEE